MLTGITGTVYQDLVGNGAHSAPLTNPPPAQAASIQLYVDSNSDGVFDAGDALATNANSGLTSANPTPQNAAGTYSFTGLSDGLYFVKQTPPSGFAQTDPTAGAVTSVQIIGGINYVGQLTVDNFNDPNPAQSYFISQFNPNPTLLKAAGPTSDIIGANRDLVIDVLGTPNPTSAQGFVGTTSGGLNALQAGSGPTGPGSPGNEVTLQYSGSNADSLTGGGTLTNAQAMNIDLTRGGALNGFRMDWNFLQVSAGAIPVQYNLTSVGGGTATYSFTALDSGNAKFSSFAPFSSFLTAGGFDFAHVSSIQVVYNSAGLQGTDYQVDDIITTAQNSPVNFADATGIADLAITKVDSVGGSSVTPSIGTAIPGNAITYTVVATNNGPNDVTGAKIADMFPAFVTSDSWTAVGTGGAANFSTSGSGAINDPAVTLPAGSTVTYTITANISPTAVGTLSNTATITPPVNITDPTPGNNTAVDVDNLTPTADLKITKIDNVGGSSITSAVGNTSVGASLIYTIVATNLGPSTVTGASVTDSFPANIGSISWTGTDGSAGNGNIADSVTLAPGASVTYTVNSTVLPAAAGTTLSNTAVITPPAGVTDPTPGNNTAVDNDAVATTSPNLTISKVDNQGGSSITAAIGSAVPGTSTLTYTIVVGNTGTAADNGVTVSDPFPASVLSDNWSVTNSTGGATSTAGGGTGNINDIVNLPAGSTLTYTVSVVHISSAAVGSLVNTVTATPTVGSPVSATDVDVLNPSADLSITKIDDQGGSSITPSIGNVVPGTTFNYTIVAKNTGPSDSPVTLIHDTFPAGVTVLGYTGSGTGGATGFTVAGVGTINDAAVSMPAGSTVTYMVSVSVSPTATGTISNTAIVASAVDSNPANNSATDTDLLTPSADLSITKIDDHGGSSIKPSTGTVIPGQNPLIYTIVVSNGGPSAVTGATVSDLFPAVITSDTWTTAVTGGASSTLGSGSGNIADTVNMPVGSTVTYTVTANVSAAATGTLSNTATVNVPAGTTDPTPGNNSATDTDTLTPTIDLSVTKTDNMGGSSIVPLTGNATPGTQIIYTVTVGNNGPSNATGATIADPLPVGITSFNWVVSNTTGGASALVNSGTGAVADTLSIPVGGTVVFTITGNIDPSAVAQLSNTATVTAGAGQTDTNPLNNSATDLDNLTPRTALSISKVDNMGGSSITPSVGNVVPGTSFVYTVLVTNTGPSTATGVTISDPLTGVVGLTGDSWTATATGGATGFSSNGNGDINDLAVTLPVGSVVTYSITANVSPAATGTLTNTATVSSPNVGAINAIDVDALTPVADLQVIKSDDHGGSSKPPVVGNVAPGGALVYTVVFTNAGPSNVIGGKINDVLPPTGLTSANWSVTGATGGASATVTSGSGNIVNDLVTMPVGSTITVTYNTVVSNGFAGLLTNTATIATPAGVTDPTPANNTAIDQDAVGGVADLSITKVDDHGGSSITPTTGTVIAGKSFQYTIVVTNNGPSAVGGATVTDTFPAIITGDTWTAVSTGGATGFTVGGSGNINDTVSMPVGSTITYTVTATLSPNTLAGPLANTAVVTLPVGVTDPTPANNTATDNDNIVLQSDLAITKVDNQGGSSITSATGSVVPGTQVVYTIVVTNNGPSAVVGGSVSDMFPAGITSDTWTASATGGASGFSGSGTGNIADLAVNMPVGSTIVYTVTANVSPAAVGTLSNTASTAVPVGTTDPNPGNNSATDNDTLVPTADLSITKVDNVGGSSVTPSTGNVLPGGQIVYTIVVTNSGPSSVTGASVVDTFPASITSDTWTATSSGGATGFSLVGAGPITDSSVNLPVGSKVTYTVTATLSAAATGTLTNTATVAAPVGVIDPTPANNTATDVDNIVGPADLSISKVDNKGGSSITASTGSVAAGSTIVYTVIVTNSGPSAVVGASVVDPFSAAIASDTFTATTNGGATGFTANGNGQIHDSVNMPSGSTITYVVTANVSAAATGALVNTATVLPPANVTDPNPLNNTATDIDLITAPQADLSITKVDNKGGSSSAPTTGTVIPGTAVTYTIVVTNNGPSAANGATIADNFPASVVSDTWTATATGGATGFTASGSGNIADTANLPSGSTITYTVTANINPAATGTLSNTATVTAPANVFDPNLANNTATDKDTLTPTADLAITKVDSAGGSSITPAVGNLVGGQTFTYTIVVTNNGPSAVTGATVKDTVPSQITSFTYTTSSTGGASDSNPTGSGSINDTLTMPSGSTLTYTISATVGSTTTAFVLSNTATVTAPVGVTDPNPANNTAIDTDNVIPGGLSSLSGHVFVDTNNNGHYDPGETPVAAVVVTLTGTTTGGTPVTESITTDSLGVYSFMNLPSGTYTITETQPVNFTPGKYTVGSQGSSQGPAGTVLQGGSPTNVIGTIALGANVNGVNNDYGEFGLAPAFISKRSFLDPNNPNYLANIQSLSGYVYTETTAGSVNFNPANPAVTEAPLAGVVITLSGTDSMGNSVTRTATTNATGFYSFTTVPVGTYSLTITSVLPAGDSKDTAFVGSQTTGIAGKGTITSIVITPAVAGMNNNFPILVTPHNAVVPAVSGLNPSAVDAVFSANH